MTVFDAFKETTFTYLTISRGEVYGNRIVAEKTLRGIVKIREGMIQESNQEVHESRSTVHAHPEDFAGLTQEQIIGNGIRYNGTDYTIDGVTYGLNFCTNKTEHLTFTLEKTDFTEYGIDDGGEHEV